MHFVIPKDQWHQGKLIEIFVVAKNLLDKVFMIMFAHLWLVFDQLSKIFSKIHVLI